VPLSAFTPLVRDWFANAFEAPTPAQERAWPAIATGDHVLISAPTGSGKTLAAFLWGLDRFVAVPPGDEHRTRLVYVSPLKALSYDVERNLRAPLRGLSLDVRVAIRTGDTPARERAAMLRSAPDILITTPESLYLMLTSRAREILGDVEAVIVDEIHAVAGTKRGAHLALTLERLEELRDGRPLQRIGLSATQRPLEEVARFMVGPTRRATIVDVGATRPLDLEIRVPVESMVEPDRDLTADPLEPVVGGEATRRSIWPAIYPQLLELVRTHRSTIVFVNSRRAAERLALRLNELAAADSTAPGEAAPAEIARAPLPRWCARNGRSAGARVRPTSATRPGSRDRPRPCRCRARATRSRRGTGSAPPSGPPRSARAARGRAIRDARARSPPRPAR
jgi:ATP-dependent Lhr-like helicase